MTGKHVPHGGDPRPQAVSVSGEPAQSLEGVMRAGLAQAGGWWPFDQFMAAALYTPGLGYYSGLQAKIGWQPSDGSDFVTAPELSPLFGVALAAQIRQALEATGTSTVVEFGAGTGALADQLLEALGDRITRYAIVDLSGTLAARQRERLRRWGSRVEWLQAWPEQIDGVVVANELLDAIPVRLLHWDGSAWWERGVEYGGDTTSATGAAMDSHPDGWRWSDRPTSLRPPVEGDTPVPEQDAAIGWAGRFVPDTTVEIHPQAEAFMTTLAERLRTGAAFFLDYGFPEREFYHPQRRGGTLMCHRAHRADTNPLDAIGCKDITAHVNFTGIALAGQRAGLEVLGYTSQAHFLLNCGIATAMEAEDPVARGNAARLLHEHEMGELFKVIGFAAGCGFDAIGFARGDRSHTL